MTCFNLHIFTDVKKPQVVKYFKILKFLLIPSIRNIELENYANRVENSPGFT